MKKLLAFVALTALTLTTGAIAQNVGTFYGEVGYSEMTVEDNSTNSLGSFSPTAARITLGKVVANNLAIEGLVVQGLSSSSHTLLGAFNVDLKLKTSYGLAIRPFMNLNEDLEVYGRLGSIRVKSKLTATRISNGAWESVDQSVTRTFYGVGAAYKLNNDWKIFTDYNKLQNKDDFMDATFFTVGARYNF